MSAPPSLLDAARLRWIESWTKGWRNSLTARYGDKNYYAELPLDVAVEMVEELATALRQLAAVASDYRTLVLTNGDPDEVEAAEALDLALKALNHGA